MARRSRPLTCSMPLQGKPIRSSISSFVNPSPKTPSSPATWTRSLTCAICWLGGIIHRARLMLPPELSLNLRRGVRLGARLNVREQDLAGDAGGHQQKAGFAIIECGVEGVAVVQFGGAALEAADDGVSSFLIECDPANHRSNPCQPHWPCDLAILA